MGLFGKNTAIMKNHRPVKDVCTRKVWCSSKEKSVVILVS